MSEVYVFANVNFAPGQYDNWQAAFKNLSEYVWSEEPITKTYYFGIPFDFANDMANTTLMFGFEVYESQAALMNIHFKSPPMGIFLEAIPPLMSTGLDFALYSFVAGFLDKPGDKRECALMHDMRVHCSTPESREIVEAALRRQVEPAVRKEDGVFTWVVCRSHDDDKEVRLFSRFRSSEDLQRYLRIPEVMAFWSEHGKKEVANIVQRGYVPNHKGWLNR